MNRVLLSIILMIGFSMSILAQNDTIWLMRGKKLAIKDYNIIKQENKDSLIAYTLLNGKIEMDFLDEVFMVQSWQGNNEYFYHPELIANESLNFEQMKSYLSGKHDARNIKVSPFVGIGAGLVGFAGALIPSASIDNGDQSVDIPLGIVAPIAYSVTMGALPVDSDNLREKMILNSTNEYYLLGCHDILQRKRINHSLIGGSIGITIGIGALLLISNF